MEPTITQIHGRDSITGFYFENLRVGSPDGTFTAVKTRAYDTKIGNLLDADSSIQGDDQLIELWFNSHTLNALNRQEDPNSGSIDSPLLRNLYLTLNYVPELANNLLALSKIITEHPEIELSNASYVVTSTELIEALLAVQNLGFHFIANKYDRTRMDHLTQEEYLATFMEGKYNFHIGIRVEDLLKNRDHYKEIASTTGSRQINAGIPSTAA